MSGTWTWRTDPVWSRLLEAGPVPVCLWMHQADCWVLSDYRTKSLNRLTISHRDWGLKSWQGPLWRLRWGGSWAGCWRRMAGCVREDLEVRTSCPADCRHSDWAPSGHCGGYHCGVWSGGGCPPSCPAPCSASWGCSAAGWAGSASGPPAGAGGRRPADSWLDERWAAAASLRQTQAWTWCNQIGSWLQPAGRH